MNKINDEKFLEFYNLLASKIYRHALFRTNSRELAEDITSQAFMKAWQYLLKKKKAIKNFKAFIYRITNNLIIDYYRQQPRAPILLDYSELKKITKIKEIRIDTDFEERIRIIIKTLNKLNPEQKRILIMHYIDELSIKEISQITGKTRNNIYVIIHRGLKNLKLYSNEKY